MEPDGIVRFTAQNRPAGNPQSGHGTAAGKAGIMAEPVIVGSGRAMMPDCSLTKLRTRNPGGSASKDYPDNAGAVPDNPKVPLREDCPPAESTDNGRVALYLRVSTEDQDLAGQERDLRTEAERRGWTVAAAYSEKVSGTGKV